MKVSKILPEQVVYDKVVDFYVPVTIRFTENCDQNCSYIYYVLTNDRYPMLEFVINENTWEIARIVLIGLYGEVRMNCCPLQEKELSVEGNPILSIDADEREYIHMKKERYVTYCWGKDITVLLENGSFYRSIRMGDVELLLNQNNAVIGCYFDHFSDDEWTLIEEIFERMSEPV